MTEKQNIFNTVVPEPEFDCRDYNIAMFIPNQDEVPDEAFILDMPEVEMILDQGAVGSCVAHSIVVAAKILNWRLTNKVIDFSPMALYGTRLAGHWTGAGMVPDQAVQVVKNEGLFYRRDFCPQLEVPDIVSATEKFKKNNLDKVEEAKKFQISGYARIAVIPSVYQNQVKTALKNNMPVIGLWTLYDSFYDLDEDGRVSVPDTKKEKIVGNHEMLIVGWTKDNEWIVVNSWGLQYGLKGVYLIPFEYYPGSLISISDTISPCKTKARHIVTTIGSNIIEVDGSPVEIDVIPYISEQNRTMVPVRFISEFLGASVEWIEATEEVKIRSEEHLIGLKIGSDKYYIDGKEFKMDVCPIIINNRTFLPIRYISEALKCKVDYKVEGDKQIVTIISL